MVLIIKNAEAEKIGKWKTKVLKLTRGQRRTMPSFLHTYGVFYNKIKRYNKKKKKINKKPLNQDS